jgi:uncharacterized protein YjiS (DUF1127 family)
MLQRTDKPIFRSTIPALAGAPAGERNKAMFTSITRLFHAWKRYGAVRRELSHLSDRELADIGITRSDIERIASDHAHG